MVWKPKEKEFTLEEALALAKNELAPFWHNSSPLLAGVKTGKITTVHPLSPDFNEFIWLIFIIDLTDSSGNMVLQCAREFHRRYHDLNLKVLVLIYPVYPFLKEAKTVQSITRHFQIPFILGIDTELLLSQSFEVNTFPKAVLVSKDKKILDLSGNDWFFSLEEGIQNFMRSHDPGLPLLNLFHPTFPWHVEVSRVELGRDLGFVFPKPGFGQSENGFSQALFTGGKEDADFVIYGHWIQDEHRIATSDPQAFIRLKCPSTHFSLVSEFLGKTADMAKIIVELNRIPVLDIFAGESLVYDDEGHSVLKLDEARLFSTLARLPEKNREITLRFPFADRNAIALYGLRFHEIVKL